MQGRSDLSQETSRGTKAGRRIHRPACGCPYTPRTEAGLRPDGPFDRQVDDAAMHESGEERGPGRIAAGPALGLGRAAVPAVSAVLPGTHASSGAACILVKMKRNGLSGCDPACHEGRSCALANATVNARHQTTAVR